MFVDSVRVILVLWIEERRPVVVCDYKRAALHAAAKSFHIGVELVP